jgi:adenylate cyclase
MSLADDWRALSRALLGEPALTPADVAVATRVDLEQARRLWRTLGFPPIADDDRVFTTADVEMLAAVRDIIASGTAPELVVQLARVIGQSLARVADAQVTALVDGAAATDPDVLVPLAGELERFLGYVWRRHLVAALFRTTAARSAPAGARLVIGFADLVGFTEIAAQLGESELAAFVERFEARAYELVPAGGGRVVKTIGDEVMFAADDPRAAARIALGLVDAFASDAILPDVRVGLASGATVAFEGDLFGQAVNLASRLVTLARPGTVLVSEEVGAELAGDAAFVLRRLRPRLKGLGRVHAWVLRAR